MNLSDFHRGPAWLSRTSGWASSTPAAVDLFWLRDAPLVACRRHYPGKHDHPGCSWCDRQRPSPFG